MAEKITSKASLVEETSFKPEDRLKMIQELKETGLKGLDLVHKIEELNSNMIIPTGRNIYDFNRKHPKSVFAASVYRTERILDESHFVYSGKSGGKDSSATANLLMLELNLRYLRVALNVTRDGKEGVDILDTKWAGDPELWGNTESNYDGTKTSEVKYEGPKHPTRRILMQMQDAEVVFTLTNDYTKRFLLKYGPQGLDLLEFNWLCLQMSWQSGVSFDSGVLVSWDKNKKSSWVQPMPNREELHGYDVVSEDNFTTCNSVPLDTLPPESQEYHREANNVVKVKRKDLFNGDKISGDPEELVEAVCNYGRGPITSYEPYSHEKEYNHDFSKWFVDTNFLVDYNSFEDLDKIQKAIGERHSNIDKEVWRMTPEESKLGRGYF